METPLVVKETEITGSSPEEKIRMRLAAELYNKSMNNTNNNNSYPTKTSDHSYSSPSSKRSSLSVREKVLATSLIFVALLAVLFFLLFIIHFTVYESEKSCMDTECVLNSALLLDKMDLSVDPCQDFHQYVCGNYYENTEIPPDKPKWGAFNELDRKNKGRLKRLLDKPGNGFRGTNSSAIAKAKKYYKACMNDTGAEERGKTPALQLIKDMGSWPMTSDPVSGTWDSSNFNLEEVLTFANLHGATPLFAFGVGQDEHNSSANVIALDQGGTIFSDRKFYFGNESDRYHSAYTQYFIDVVDLLGGDKNDAIDMAEKMWDFETKLAEAQDPEEDRSDYNQIYHRMTIEEAAVNITSFNLSLFLNSVFSSTIPGGLPHTEPVVMYNVQFFSDLSTLVSKTDPSVLTCYMVWHVIRTTVPYLSTDFQRARQSANALLDGVSSMPDHWLTCVSTTEATLNLATGALYVDKYFSPKDKRDAREMVHYIRESFRGALPGVNWMDKTTRDKALEKVDAIIEKIGYPDLIDDVNSLDQYYHTLQVSDDNSFENMLSSVQFYTTKALKKLHSPVDRTEWHMAADEVNAYYNANNNEIVFPAGILQLPFYSSNYPMAMNFGAIGMVIGHELTHGFDNTGRQFDGKGNLNNWWQPASLTHFEERTDCLVNQYGDYKVQGESVNGRTTLGENIADNGGIKTSFHAYHSWLKNHNNEDHGSALPGLDLTPDQLYFVGFAQLWCTFTTPEYALQALVSDPHSPAKYRIVGAVSNSEDFARAFSCPKNSPMNPNSKCSVW